MVLIAIFCCPIFLSSAIISVLFPVELNYDVRIAKYYFFLSHACFLSSWAFISLFAHNPAELKKL